MNTMKVLNQNGDEIICKIIAKWKQNNVNYLAYTIDTTEDLYISKINNNNGKIIIQDIEDDHEWDSCINFLENNLYDNGDLYD